MPTYAPYIVPFIIVMGVFSAIFVYIWLIRRTVTWKWLSRLCMLGFDGGLFFLAVELILLSPVDWHLPLSFLATLLVGTCTHYTLHLRKIFASNDPLDDLLSSSAARDAIIDVLIQYHSEVLKRRAEQARKIADDAEKQAAEMA